MIRLSRHQERDGREVRTRGIEGRGRGQGLELEFEHRHQRRIPTCHDLSEQVGVPKTVARGERASHLV